MRDSHPIRAAWHDYQKTPEYLKATKLHDPSALFDGFCDGYMAGRSRASIHSEEKPND